MKTKEETLKLYNEYIVGKTFDDYSALRDEISWRIGNGSARTWLIEESQKDQLMKFKTEIKGFKAAYNSLISGCIGKMFTRREDINDRDLATDELWNDYIDTALTYMIYEIEKTILVQKALRDGVKLKYLRVENPNKTGRCEFDGDEYDDDDYIVVPNKYLEES